MTKKALITGITGQDGSHTSAALSTSLTEFLLAERFSGWHRWEEQVLSMEQIHR